MLKFRCGQVQLVRFRVSSETQITPGDLVYISENSVKPVSEFNEGPLSSLFAGIAHTSSNLGETHDVLVDISPFSVYEMDIAPTRYEIGDFVSPAKYTTFENQKLSKAVNPSLRIGRTVEYANVREKTIRVSFASSLHVTFKG